jgi:glycoside/pentoside/hexuronide:cation symporter, GPH family
MNTTPVSAREKLSYSLGEFGSNLFWQSFNMFLMFFYTDIYGISAVTVGTIFLVARCWDVFADGAVGVISDRTQTRWGKFRPYILWFAIPFSVVGVLTFSTPPFGNTGKVIYALITYTLMMSLYSLVMIPYNSLLGVMSSDQKERNSISTWKFAFAFSSGIVVQYSTLRLVDLFGKGDRQTGYSLTVLFFAIITAALLIFAFYNTKERVTSVNQQNTLLKDDLKDLFANIPWVVVTIANLTMSAYLGIRLGVVMYYFKYYLDREAMAAIFMVTGTLGSLLGTLLVPLILRFISKQGAFFWLMLGSSIFTVLSYFPGPDQLIPIFLWYGLASLGLGAVFPILWTMLADAADYSEWKNGRRATGLVYSASGLCGKFGWSVGSAMLGWILGAYGFHPNQIQAAGTLSGIRLLFSIIPAAGTLVAAIIMYWYPITDAKLKEIAEAMAVRKETVAERSI